MIVNHRKKGAGLLAMPVIKNKQIVKTLYIYPGHNDIPEEDWEAVKEHLKEKIAAGDLVIYEKPIIVKEKKKVVKPEASSDIDLLSEANFPYNKIVEILEKEDMLKDLQAQKKEETKSKTLSKVWLIDYFKEVTEDWEFILSKLSPVEEETPVEVVTALALDEMEASEALNVIADTFNMETLEGWKKEVNSPDLRTAILNQIDELKKPLTK